MAPSKQSNKIDRQNIVVGEWDRAERLLTQNRYAINTNYEHVRIEMGGTQMDISFIRTHRY